MRSERILPLLAVLPLLGCDGTGESFRGPASGTAYAAPLASDTSVVTTRRVWSSVSDTSVSISFYSSTIMPDGIGMATTDWISGDPAVFDLVSKEVSRFRFNDEPYDTGMTMNTVASPDGGQIAFDWLDFPEGESYLLRVLDVATGESRTLLARDTVNVGYLEPAAWTAAGDSVFVLLWPPRGQGGDLEVVLIPAAGGTARPVHTIPQPARPGSRMSLSPDGRWILYDHDLSRDQQSRSDIYIIDVQGGGARPLVEHPAVDLLVGWLPGTDVVLFSSDRSGTTDLWSVRVAGGRTSAEPRLVRSGFFRSTAVGFGDGALFYGVETGSSGPAVIGVDPQSGALLGPSSPPLRGLNTFYRALAWSPDGQTLAAPSWGPGRRTITLHSLETGERRVFWLDEGVTPLNLEWAADGRALFVRAGEAGRDGPTGPHHFLRLDLGTGTMTRVFAAADPEESGPLWRFVVTPDGRSIILRQQRTLDDDRTEMKLVLRSLEDGSERELHRTTAFIPEFSISADGTQLAFMQQAGEDSDSLFVMRMDGSQPPRAIASWDHSWDDAISLLGWLPAGNALLGARLTGPYSSSRAGDGPREEILRIELDGSITVVGISPFPPTRGSRVQGYHRSRLVLSSAGNRLAHNVIDTGEELWRMDGLPELFAEDAAGRR